MDLWEWSTIPHFKYIYRPVWFGPKSFAGLVFAWLLSPTITNKLGQRRIFAAQSEHRAALCKMRFHVFNLSQIKLSDVCFSNLPQHFIKKILPKCKAQVSEIRKQEWKYLSFYLSLAFLNQKPECGACASSISESGLAPLLLLPQAGDIWCCHVEVLKWCRIGCQNS